MLQPNEFFNELEAEHRQWLSASDAQYLRNFEKIFNADYEAAMTEAAVRRLLQGYGVSIDPNEDLTGASRQPDFFCSDQSHNFYVEVTCISIEKAVKKTGMPDIPTGKAQHYSMLNDSFWSSCKGKAAQCGNLDHPVLVAIGTFHHSASCLCVEKHHVEMLLTGETKIAWNMDMTTGQQVGETYLQTDLYSAVFLKPEKETEIGFARSSISGLLLCGLGVEPPKTLGILHPNPVRRFEQTTLADVSFCEVAINQKTDVLTTSWTGGSDY